MLQKVSTEEIVNLLESALPITGNIIRSSNWFRWSDGDSPKAIYVSQCKPSSYSKGNWYYEFFHTLSSKSMDKILQNHHNIVLIDYATRRFTILDHEDISWVYENSSRVRKKGGLVTDFVVRMTESEYYLEPSLAGTGLYRTIEVREFQ